MKKEVELSLTFQDYKNNNELEAIKTLIPQTPYSFWKEGDFITKANGDQSKSRYKYSQCAYMMDANYDSLEDDIYYMLNIFLPFEQQLIALKEKHDFEITFTLHFDSRRHLLPFVIELKYLSFLSRIKADLEFY